jgi:hypothetical protein
VVGESRSKHAWRAAVSWRVLAGCARTYVRSEGGRIFERAIACVGGESARTPTDVVVYWDSFHC